MAELKGFPTWFRRWRYWWPAGHRGRLQLIANVGEPSMFVIASFGHHFYSVSIYSYNIYLLTTLMTSRSPGTSSARMWHPPWTLFPHSIKHNLSIFLQSFIAFGWYLVLEDNDDQSVTGHVFRMFAINSKTHWIYGMQNSSSYWEVFPEISMGSNALVIKAGRNIKFISSAGEASNCADAE